MRNLFVFFCKVLILRRLIWEMSSPKAPGMAGNFFGGGKDLKAEEVQIWHGLYNRLEFFSVIFFVLLVCVCCSYLLNNIPVFLLFME